MKIPDITELLGRHSFDKFLKTNYLEFYNHILNNYPKELTTPQRLYWYYHDINKHPTCPECGNPLKFYSFRTGYQMFCSYLCAANSKYKINKTKNTCNKKYGGLGFASKAIYKISRDTMIKRYGEETPLRIEQFKNKKSHTMVERYGEEYRLQNKEYSDRLHIKMQHSIKSKYGEKGIFGNKKIQNKIKQTCLERYGDENPMKSPEVQNKIKQTCLERYGDENPMKSPEVQNKIKQTCLERYGTESPFQSDVIKNKIRQTCLKRYGTESPSQSKEIQNKIYDTKKKNHTLNTSQVEKDFELYLTTLGIKHKTQYRSELYPFNCDFYIPEYDLYIEIQAGWFHGHHPYDSESDKETLEIWKSKKSKFYDNAIETWTIRDVKKRNVATQNNLNYLEIFANNANEVIKQFEDHIHN